MTDLVAVPDQLKEERSQLDRAITALSGVIGGSSVTPSNKGKRAKRTMSAAARKRIAAAQKARWAKVRAKAA
jgi:hypothetical protein